MPYYPRVEFNTTESKLVGSVAKRSIYGHTNSFTFVYLIPTSHRLLNGRFEWIYMVEYCRVHYKMRLRESSSFCILKLKLQVTKVTDVCTSDKYQ